jgi:hypothetical protein
VSAARTAETEASRRPASSRVVASFIVSSESRGPQSSPGPEDAHDSVGANAAIRGVARSYGWSLQRLQLRATAPNL